MILGLHAVYSQDHADTVTFISCEKQLQVDKKPGCLDMNGPTVVYHKETGVIECYADEEMKKLVYEYQAKRKRNIFRRTRKSPRHIKTSMHCWNELVLHDLP
jgi:hypothetical protein